MTGVSSSTDLDGLVTPALATLGFELVQIRMLGGSHPTLQVMAEPVDRERVMTVEDCAQISHAVSAILDVHDPIEGEYSLEVSSPGLERPLVRAEHFIRFKGQRARIETMAPVEGRKQFTGLLVDCDGERVTVEGDGLSHTLPLAMIRRARLVLDGDKGRKASPRRGR